MLKKEDIRKLKYTKNVDAFDAFFTSMFLSMIFDGSDLELNDTNSAKLKLIEGKQDKFIIIFIQFKNEKIIFCRYFRRTHWIQSPT